MSEEKIDLAESRAHDLNDALCDLRRAARDPLSLVDDLPDFKHGALAGDVKKDGGQR